MGKAVFSITLGNLTLDSELIVAEIEDEALLGLDILMKGKGGPADIKSFDEITVLAAPVSAVKVTLIPCILPST
jgi:hypothetical protein